MTTWTTSLRLEKQVTGSNSNTWGDRLDLGVIDLVDAAVAGARALVLAGNYSLTTANGGDDDARNAMLLFTGAAGAVNVTMPTAAKMYLVRNGNSGAVTMKMAAGGTVAVPAAGTRWVYSDGTDVKDALADYLLSSTAATTYQPLNTALSAYAGLGTTGIDVRTAAGTVASRSLAAPAAGFTITNSDGVAGNPTFVLANDLAQVEALATNGIVTRTASETWTTRTITGTANEITATNGDGVAGAPTLSLPTALTDTGKTVTGGTFSGGTLSGGTVSGTTTNSGTISSGTVNPTTLQQGGVAVGTAAFQATGTSGATIPFLNGANTWSGVQTYSAVAENWAKGTTIASATTADIGAALGNYVQISGTTTITGLGTIQAGTLRVVEFQGALTLTHDGTALILPGAASIATAAGDVAVFVSEGSGNWRCVTYTKAAIAPSGGGRCVVPFQGQSGISAGQTFFYGAGIGTALEVDVSIPVPFACTVKNLFAASRAAPGGSETYVYMIRKNAADTTLTCTISAAALSANDATHFVSFAAGDLLALRVVASASATATTMKAMVELAAIA